MNCVVTILYLLIHSGLFINRYTAQKCIWDLGCGSDEDCADGTYCNKDVYWSQCQEIEVFESKAHCFHTFTPSKI